MVFPAFLVSAAFLLFSPFVTCPSHGVIQDVLATICSQTQNQEYCIGLLQSDLRTSSADIPLLSLISLELAIHQADENYQAFVQYKKNSTQKGLSDSFGNSATFYQDMKDKLQADHQLSK
ncbi:hypothetical protein SLEP1_g14036 [Rubroshorea leprosula]|uniref:Pectinesterase inhibitor domain-containing protein n=1 Tax=Rubroshorea leprosula TaxID=152421 RepID=A0AAV5IS82_9ROSI|nr:hypothetical protein SLEP1_g14036 [Rubroshorea leprosula]